MNREKAVSLIKQIFEQCSSIEGKSISLLPPKGNDALSDTYQVHIQTRNDDRLISCITNIASEHNLDVKVKEGLCVVYQPYPNVKQQF